MTLSDELYAATIMPKLLLHLASLILVATPLQAEPPASAQGAFTEIASQLTSGNIEGALESMTPKAKEEYISQALINIATKIASGEKFPTTSPNSTQLSATPASLGFDTFEFPTWLTTDNGPDPSKKALATFKERLISLLNESTDRTKSLQSLYQLNQAIQPGIFSSKIIPPKEDSPTSPGRIWIKSNQDERALALTFEKKENQWLYSGIDTLATNARANQFTAIENLEISGKTLEGKEFNLSDLKDKIVLIDFWGTW